MMTAIGIAEQVPLVLVLATRPASFQSNGRAKYQSRIRAEVLVAFQGRAPIQGSLYARITYFHREPTTQDVDNIIKPILDASAGVVFADDRAVRQCLAERIFIPDDFLISEQHRPSGVFDQLVDLLADTTVQHITYIEIGQAPDQRVSFGPIEGRQL